MAQNAILKLISDRKFKRKLFKNKNLHTFLQGYEQSTEKKSWKCNWKFKTYNMSFLIQNINALIQCIQEIEPNLSVAKKY